MEGKSVALFLYRWVVKMREQMFLNYYHPCLCGHYIFVAVAPLLKIVLPKNDNNRRVPWVLQLFCSLTARTHYLMYSCVFSRSCQYNQKKILIAKKKNKGRHQQGCDLEENAVYILVAVCWNGSRVRTSELTNKHEEKGKHSAGIQCPVLTTRADALPTPVTFSLI